MVCFESCPGVLPEMSRRCPGVVPELSRRCIVQSLMSRVVSLTPDTAQMAKPIPAKTLNMLSGHEVQSDMMETAGTPFKQLRIVFGRYDAKPWSSLRQLHTIIWLPSLGFVPGCFDCA